VSCKKVESCLVRNYYEIVWDPLVNDKNYFHCTWDPLISESIDYCGWDPPVSAPSPRSVILLSSLSHPPLSSSSELKLVAPLPQRASGWTTTSVSCTRRYYSFSPPSVPPFSYWATRSSECSPNPFVEEIAALPWNSSNPASLSSIPCGHGFLDLMAMASLTSRASGGGARAPAHSGSRPSARGESHPLRQ
jgi:hypothetical protein